MITALAVIADTTIVTGLALLVCLALRRRSAALRHTILAASLAAVAVAPALEATLPHWELPVLSGAAPVVAPGPTLSSELPPAAAATAIAVPVAPNRSWATTLVTVWAIGFLLVMAGLLAGLVRLVRMTRSCRPVRASAWHERAETLSAQCSLPRPVVVLESNDRAPLLTWGLLRPRIVVPAGAVSWTAERIEIVLAHELAHIERRDWALQIAAEVLRAVYWFNPLIWMVCRRLRDEAEQACDDAVLRRGVDAADYASHLLAVARQVHTSGRGWASAPAVANPSTLERRIAVILNLRRTREPLAQATRVLTSLAVLAAMVPVAAATLTDRVEPTFGPSARGDITLSAPIVVPEAPVVPLRRARPAPPPIVAAPVPALAQPAPAPSAPSAPPAQGASSLSGTIRDATGGVMPGVLVALTGKTSGARLSTTTDSNGAFRFRGLEPSEYDFFAQLPGFATLREVVRLAPAQELQSSLTMKVGSLTETLLITCVPAAATHPATVGAGLMAYERKAVAPRLFTMPGRTQDVRPTLAAQQLPVRVGGNIKAPQRLKSVTSGCPGVPPADGLVVIMEGTIGTDGLVKDIVLLKPTPPDAAGLARAALDAFRQWEYTPTLLNNVPTAVTVTATIVFRRP